MKIYIEIGSYTGLGNQLFQLFFLILMSEKYNLEPFIKPIHRFCINDFFIINEKIKYIDSIPSDLILYEEKDIDKIDGKNDIIISGYFQKFKYYNNKQFLLSKYIQFIPNIYINIISEINLIKNNNKLVIIHCRMPDFKEEKIEDFEYTILSNNFINTCINEIYNKHNNIIFLLLSNDIDRCKTIYTNNKITFYNNDKYDIYRLFLGDYYILSPSSYSWWPVFFNINNNISIYTCKPWYNINKHCNILNKDNEIYNPNWIIYDN